MKTSIQSEKYPSLIFTLALFACACLVGAIAPVFPIPITPDTGIPWDALPRIMSLCFFGLPEGIVAALAVSITTWVAKSGSWIAVALPVMETSVVFLLMKTHGTGPLLAECLYWSVMGVISFIAIEVDFETTFPKNLPVICLGSLMSVVIVEICLWLPISRFFRKHPKPPIRELMATSMMAAVIMVSLTAVVTHDSLARRNVEKALREDTHVAVTTVAKRIDGWLTRRIEAISPAVKLAFHDWIKPSEALVSSLEGLVAALPEFKSISVMNAKGEVIISHPPNDALGVKVEGRRILDRVAWSAMLSSKKPHISGLRFSPTTFRPSVDMIIPILGKMNRLLGAVAASLDLSPLHRSLAASKTEATGSTDFTIVDPSRLVVVSTRKDLHAMDVFYFLGTDDFVVSARIKTAPWVLVAEGDPGKAFEDVSRSTSIVLAFLVPSALLSFLLASAFSAVLSHPLSILAKITRRLPETVTLGKEKIEWPVPLSREASILVSNFRNTAMNLRDLWIELEHMKDDLERQVIKRTRELEEANRELRRLATIDKLTGLWNRVKLDEFMKREMERSRRHGNPLSVMMIDLDHFKEVNDTHGHQKGDEVLSSVGELLSESCRKTDLAARFGGEEILVALTETPIDKARILAERIRERVSKLSFVGADGKTFNVTCSIGIAQYDPKMHSSIKELIKFADSALYWAKANGRDRVEIHYGGEE